MSGQFDSYSYERKVDINAEPGIYKHAETVDKIQGISGGELAKRSTAQFCKGEPAGFWSKEGFKDASNDGKSGL